MIDMKLHVHSGLITFLYQFNYQENIIQIVALHSLSMEMINIFACKTNTIVHYNLYNSLRQSEKDV